MEGFLSFTVEAVQYVLPFLIVLGIVVFAHELGHFWVARRCGVRVEAFSIGFGPEICAWHDRRGTRWRLAWIPLGGYVQMFGDADPSSFGPGEKAQALTEDEKKTAFYAQRLSKRFAIVAAGPVANYLFAIVVLSFLYGVSGQPYASTVVSDVKADGVAIAAGMRAGDKILAIDDKEMTNFDDIQRTISMNTGTPVAISLERDGVRQTLVMTPKISRSTDRFGGEHARGLIGIVSTSMEVRDLPPASAVFEAGRTVLAMTQDTLRGVGQMLMGMRGADELGGPLRIAEMSGKVAREGVAAFVWFLAVISVNLGLINLFPIPLLDGGHLAFYLLEGLLRRPLSDKTLEYGAKAGAALVGSLMLFATWNDLVRLQFFSFFHRLFL